MYSLTDISHHTATALHLVVGSFLEQVERSRNTQKHPETPMNSGRGGLVHVVGTVFDFHFGGLIQEYAPIPRNPNYDLWSQPLMIWGDGAEKKSEMNYFLLRVASPIFILATL